MHLGYAYLRYKYQLLGSVLGRLNFRLDSSNHGTNWESQIMDGIVVYVGVAFLGGILWEVMSLVNVVKESSIRLYTISNELGEISSQLGNVDSIYGEMQWHKDLSSMSRVLKQLEAIESAIQKLDI